MRTSGAGGSTERSERTLRQQRPQGEPRSGESSSITDLKSLPEQAFLHLGPVRMRTSGAGEVRLAFRRPAQAHGLTP